MAELYPGEAQIQSNCQFCEVSKIKYKCLNCDLLLCQLCNSKIHSKSKASQDHKVVGLEDLGTEYVANKQREINLENIMCYIHPEQRCFSYCNDCCRPNCFECVQSTNTCREHSSEELTKSYEKKMTALNDMKDNFDSDNAFFDQEVEKILKILKDSKMENDHTKEMIRTQEKEINDSVTSYVTDILDRVDKENEMTEVKIQGIVANLHMNKEKLKKRLLKVETALMSSQALGIFETCHQTENIPLEPVEFSREKIKFIPGNVALNKLQEIVGNTMKVYNFEHVETVGVSNSKLINVSKILNIDENTKAIGSSHSNCLKIVKFERNLMEVKKTLNNKVLDMAKFENGDVAVSSLEKILYVYRKRGTLEHYKNFGHLYTLGIHVNKERELIVGLVESTAMATCENKTSISRIVVLDKKTKENKYVYEFDQNNEKLFTGPRRISSIGDYIIVLDLINTALEGTIIMMDYRGRIRWKYDGKDISSPPQKFYPSDMQATSDGAILVTDCENHSLHILNETGQVITIHNLKNIGIEYPFSLYLEDKLLWIGCTNFLSDKQPTAKLHTVKF